MKRLFLLVALLAISFVTYSQRARKSSGIEASEKTADQRLVQETDRKSKGNKKKVSVKKKVRIQEKQYRQAKRIKPSKRKH